MEISVSNQNHATVLDLGGRLDGIASPELEKVVEARIDDGATKLVFDCAKLNYVSSAGLRAFLSSAKKVQSAGGKVAFASLQPNVVEIFELSGFSNIFTLKSDVAAAVAAVN